MEKSASVDKVLLHKLQKSRLAVLSTSDRKGQSHPSVVWYFMLNDAFELFILTRRHTQKYKDILVNPKVGLVVGFGPKPDTIQMHGIAKPMKKVAARGMLAEAIENNPPLKKRYLKLGSSSPFLKMKGLDMGFIHIRLTWVRRMYVPRGKKSAVYQEIRP